MTTFSQRPSGSSHSSNLLKQYQSYKENSKSLHREQRGLMQWKPMRNLQFAKNEAKFAMRKVRNKGILQAAGLAILLLLIIWGVAR